MVGPSSSHTAGAVRIGFVAQKLLGEPVKRARIGPVSYTHLIKRHSVKLECLRSFINANSYFLAKTDFPLPDLLK